MIEKIFKQFLQNSTPTQKLNLFTSMGITLGIGARIVINDNNLTKIYQSVSETFNDTTVGEVFRIFANAAEMTSEIPINQYIGSLYEHPKALAALEIVTSSPIIIPTALAGLGYGIYRIIKDSQANN